jgi:hypothetical protein
MSELIEKLIKESKRIEEDAEHSFKGHYNASDIWAKRHLWLGIPSALFAALAGIVIIKECAVLSAAFAISSAALTTILTFIKPSEKAEVHKAVAGQYQKLRNDTRLFHEIEVLNSNDEDFLKNRLLELSGRRDDLNNSSPLIPNKAYEQAKKDIDDGRAQYRADAGE